MGAFWRSGWGGDPEWRLLPDERPISETIQPSPGGIRGREERTCDGDNRDAGQDDGVDIGGTRSEPDEGEGGGRGPERGAAAHGVSDRAASPGLGAPPKAWPGRRGSSRSRSRSARRDSHEAAG